MKKFFYPLVQNPFRRKDLSEGIKVLKSANITLNKKTLNFEKFFKKKLKLNYSLMVNSGSSANLLAFQCLINPYRRKRLKHGDKVLIPSVCWSTSLWPIIQSGLKPVFVDVNPDTLNIDLDDLKRKINKKTKALMLVHVLGNSTDMYKLMAILKNKNIFLIEDTCESIGAKFKNKYLGSYGDFSSFSFYSSHQISSGEGGMINCKTREDYEILLSLRSHGWSRGLRNERKIASANKHLDPKFIFYNSGFNLRPTEISAAIGSSQFKDLDRLISLRNKNRDLIVSALEKNNKIKRNLKFIEKNSNTKPSWFGIPVLLNKSLNKKKFLKKIEKSGIETRPIISGNFINQPSVRKYKLHNGKKFPNSEIINNQGFFMGLPANKLNKKFINKIVKIFEKNL